MDMKSVQAIAALSAATGDIPAEYIRPEHEQPGPTAHSGTSMDVPVIDMSDTERLVGNIARASEEWGIFQVVNHGIAEEVIMQLQQVGQQFFALPQKEKETVAMSLETGVFQGYGSELAKVPPGKKAWRDFLFHIVWPASAVDDKFWPENPPEYRKANEEYTRYMVKLVDVIFTSLSEGLCLEKEVLKEAAGADELRFLLKVNYYPQCPRPELVLGLGAHTDMSTIAVLVPNDVPGLQILRDDRWIDVNYVPNALIVHVGDQIEILSNGKYKSVLHRSKVSKEKVRMSWGVFLEPPEEMIVGPLPQLVSKENPAKFKTTKYKDYQSCKINKLTR